MNIISHGFSSYYVVLILSQVYTTAYSTSLPMLVLYFLISFIPDLSGLWSKKLKSHHKGFWHAPLFWGLLLMIGVMLGYTKIASLIFWIVIFHLLNDYITGRTTGIPIFYPFSKKEYTFKKINPEAGNFNINKILSNDFWEYTTFYFKDRILILFEIFIVVVGLASLYLIAH